MLKPTWWPFSRYADALEKQVDKLLRKVASIGVFEAQRRVVDLMQQNLVIVNLWMEARFKGYKYLSRGARKRMYRNSEKIAGDFLPFAEGIRVSDEAIVKTILGLGLHVPGGPGMIERLRMLVAIMEYLRPSEGRFVYLEGASFGKLLTDPDRKQKMIGDCNQIVTFYTYLYSLKFPLKELQIKIMKGHVCLHFQGVDIEATGGGFAHYKEFLRILPIVELISTNLLDVSDFRDKQIQVHPKDFLKAAELAFDLSSEREIVASNLKTAYQNVAIDLMQNSDFPMAEFFLQKAGVDDAQSQGILQSIYHNAVVYYVKAGSYAKARLYAGKSSEGELRKYVDEKEAFSCYESGQLERARELFGLAGNSQMIKACYGKEYNQVQARVAGVRDLETMKSHRWDYEKMLELAVKMEDAGLAEKVRGILSQL